MDYSLPRLKRSIDLFKPLRNWLENIPVKDEKTAQRIVSLIPADCPFERDIKIFGRVVGHIPPMCKLNPLYDQFVMLRFKAMCYLVDECGQDAAAFS